MGETQRDRANSEAFNDDPSSGLSENELELMQVRNGNRFRQIFSYSNKSDKWGVEERSGYYSFVKNARSLVPPLLQK